MEKCYCRSSVMTNVAQNCQSLRSSYTTVPLAIAHTQKIRQEKGKQGGGRVNKSKKDFISFFFFFFK